MMRLFKFHQIKISNIRLSWMLNAAWFIIWKQKSEKIEYCVDKEQMAALPFISISDLKSLTRSLLFQLLTTGAPLPTLRWTFKSGRRLRCPPLAPSWQWTAMSTPLEETGSVWASSATYIAPRLLREQGRWPNYPPIFKAKQLTPYC